MFIFLRDLSVQFTLFLIITVLLPGSLAAPAAAGLDSDILDLSDHQEEFSSKLGTFIDNLMYTAPQSAWCDRSRIKLPKAASGLPSPTGQQPLYVAIGRGTQVYTSTDTVSSTPVETMKFTQRASNLDRSNSIQNYTCSSPSSNETPKAIGAVATLYDVTCMAANFPDMLPVATDIAYNALLPTGSQHLFFKTNIPVLGHHYFQRSVPIFNLDTSTHRDGLAVTTLQDKMDAPVDAVSGCKGAVEWLYLSTIEGTTGDYSSVYRVNTASGQPPKTCDGMPLHFEVPYAGSYYFFVR